MTDWIPEIDQVVGALRKRYPFLRRIEPEDARQIAYLAVLQAMRKVGTKGYAFGAIRIALIQAGLSGLIATPQGCRVRCINSLTVDVAREETATEDAEPSYELLEAVDSLPAKERVAVTRYYGLDGGTPDDLWSLADRLGVCTNTARRFLRQGFRGLRSILEGRSEAA